MKIYLILLNPIFKYFLLLSQFNIKTHRNEDYVQILLKHHLKKSPFVRNSIDSFVDFALEDFTDSLVLALIFSGVVFKKIAPVYEFPSPSFPLALRILESLPQIPVGG